MIIQIKILLLIMIILNVWKELGYCNSILIQKIKIKLRKKYKKLKIKMKKKN